MAILSESSIQANCNKETKIIKLFNDESADETTSTAVDARNYDQATIVAEWSAGSAAGVVVLEGAITSDYAGTWDSLKTLTWAAASGCDSATISLNNPANSAFLPYLRARLSSHVDSGTVDVYLVLTR